MSETPPAGLMELRRTLGDHCMPSEIEDVYWLSMETARNEAPGDRDEMWKNRKRARQKRAQKVGGNNERVFSDETGQEKRRKGLRGKSGQKSDSSSDEADAAVIPRKRKLQLGSSHNEVGASTFEGAPPTAKRGRPSEKKRGRKRLGATASASTKKSRGQDTADKLDLQDTKVTPFIPFL